MLYCYGNDGLLMEFHHLLQNTHFNNHHSIGETPTYVYHHFVNDVQEKKQYVGNCINDGIFR